MTSTVPPLTGGRTASSNTRLVQTRTRAVTVGAQKSVLAQNIERQIAQCDADIARYETSAARYSAHLDRHMASDATATHGSGFVTIRSALANALQKCAAASEARRILVLAQAKLMAPARAAIHAVPASE